MIGRRGFLGSLLALLVPVKLDPVSKPEMFDWRTVRPTGEAFVPQFYVDFENIVLNENMVVACLVHRDYLPDGTVVTRSEFLEPIKLMNDDTLKLNYTLEYK